jgi:3-oxoacyl-[acyl-carrier-protein] synthase-1
VTSALGAGRQAHAAALHAGRTGLRRAAFESSTLDTWTGIVHGLEDAPIQGWLADWDCRNNRLARLALEQDGFLQSAARLREKYGARRVGVFVGTSTAGIQQTELAYRARDRAGNRLPDWFHFRQTQNTFSCADYVRELLQLEGVALAVSTACSSSAKVFASACRAMRTGQCDAAIVGGVDSLCLTTLYGFNALQLLSPDICRPADAARNGISIGEAAGFAILEEGEAPALALLGYGESSDAHHMSAPHPQGVGALACMRAALERAQLQPRDIEYINLHGTGTPANDAAEDQAVCGLFGQGTPCSSTKGWTGHTLGAAGVVEAAITLLAIEHGYLPQSLNTRVPDPLLHSRILMQPLRAPLRRAMSNSFGFGGSNVSLVFGQCA